MLRLSFDYICDLHEILPRSLRCGYELCDWKLTLDACSFLAIFLNFFHNFLDSVQQVDERVLFMTIDLVQIEALYQF